MFSASVQAVRRATRRDSSQLVLDAPCLSCHVEQLGADPKPERHNGRAHSTDTLLARSLAHHHSTCKTGILPPPQRGETLPKLRSCSGSSGFRSFAGCAPVKVFLRNFFGVAICVEEPVAGSLLFCIYCELKAPALLDVHKCLISYKLQLS